MTTACRECGGTGAEPGTSPVICPECNGRGVISESQGLFALSQPCPRCRGNGTVIEKPCKKCKGSGRERRTKRYTVKIPAGRQGRHADPAQGQGRARGSGGRGGRPVRRHARRAVEEVRAARRRSPDRSAGDLYGGGARRNRRGADAVRRARVAEGSRRNAGRPAAAHPRPRRAEARRQRQGRPHRAAARRACRRSCRRRSARRSRNCRSCRTTIRGRRCSREARGDRPRQRRHRRRARDVRDHAPQARGAAAGQGRPE